MLNKYQSLIYVLLTSFIILSASFSPSSILKSSKIIFKYKETCTFNSQSPSIIKIFKEDFIFLENLNMGIMTISSSTISLHLLKKLDKCIESVVFNKSIRRKRIQVAKGDLKYKGWHLKRLNHVNMTRTVINSYDRKLLSEKPQVQSHVLIFDTGIDGKHKEIINRLGPSHEHFSFIDHEYCCDASNALCDCDNHGTHVAGLVASDVAGYDTNALVYSYKVMDGKGTLDYSSFLMAINKAMSFKKSHPNDLVIVNMSLGLDENNIKFKNVINKLVNTGVFTVIAAGNEKTDACDLTPGNTEEVVTVGSFDINDRLSDFSNYGECVDIYAPGSDIYSTLPGNKYGLLSGTSMASPIICGFASAIGSANGIINPADLWEEIKKWTVSNKVKGNKKKILNNIIPFDGYITKNEEDN